MNHAESREWEGGGPCGWLDGRYRMLRLIELFFLPESHIRVYQAYDQKTSRQVAVKVMRRACIQSYYLMEQFIREVSTIARLHHPHVVRLYQVKVNGNLVVHRGRIKHKTYYVMQLAHFGELFRFLQSGPLSECLAKYFFRQMLKSKEINNSSAKVAHCDIKSENLLVSHDFQLMLSDFGSSMSLESSVDAQQLKGGIGSPEYNPPEVTSHEVTKVRLASIDLFQSGVVLFTMLFSSQPFQSAQYSDPYYRLFLQDPSAYWSIFPDVASPQALDLIAALLERDPETRICLEAVENHPWLQQNDDDDLEAQLSQLSLSLPDTCWEEEEEEEEERPVQVQDQQMQVVIELNLELEIQGQGGNKKKENVPGSPGHSSADSSSP